jgi:subtilisin family serine protease
MGELRNPSERWKGRRMTVLGAARVRRAFLHGVAGAIALSVLVVAGGAAAQSPPGSDEKLGKADRDRVASAQRAGRPTVTLLIAARRDRVDQAAADVRALGGVVEARDNRVDYLKVSIPTGKADDAARLGSISAVDVDGLIPLDDPRPEGAENPLPQPPPGASTPRDNPYLPIGDTGAAQFTADHPTWDGRGTVVAVLDSGVDLDHPSLSTTTTGQDKIVDWYNANSPTSGDATWVTTTGRFNGSFTASGRAWTAPPAGGPYSFGVLVENAGELAAGELGGDVDRDGTPGESIGVLQDRTTKDVMVDRDQDGDFTDETRMIDFKVKRDVGHLGTDNPATAVQEAVPFVVVTDRSAGPGSDAPSLVNIGIAGAAHGSHVAGIATGNRLFGGAMSGAAPGAQVMAVKVCLTTTSCTNSGLIDGVLYAARNGADVANISIGGLPALNDGNNARALLYDRTIDEFGMQLFLSAGNSGAGANTVGDPSVATKSVSVAASATSATWLRNYGSVTAAPFSLMPFSSRGPREDGGLKPTLTAPGSAISTTPPWQPGGPVAGTYALPPGYAMFNGTSMAAPQATGAAALLVSAYKATHGGERPDAAALRNALMSSADFKPSIGAYGQGTGLLSVAPAWQALDDGPAPYAITASVPVNTVLSGLLATPGRGIGIHDREGVAVGEHDTRTYTLARTSGPAGRVRAAVSFAGNDGTFATRGSLHLPLNEPTELRVSIDPETAGIHSALLKVDVPGTNGVDLVTQNVVFAPEQFTAAGGHALTMSGTVARNDTRHLLVRVPEGASALRVDLEGGGDAAGAGQIRFARFTPQGLGLDPTGSTTCYVPDAGGGCPGGTARSRTVTNPQAGVWELVVESRRTSDAAEAPFTLTARVLAVTITPNPDTVPSPPLGEPITRTYTIANSLAAFTGRLVGGGALGSTQTQRPTIANLAQQDFDVVLPAGVTSYTITTGNAADPRADIDLVVFRCTTPTSCTQVGASGGATAVERVALTNPPAGVYRIRVVGFAVPAGSTAYDIADTWISPALGSVTASDADALRPAGSSWTATAAIVRNAEPGPGRRLTGTVRVVDDGGATLREGAITLTP